MNAEGICADLIRADHEDEIVGILTHHGLDEEELWLPLGGIENNLSIAGNQQSSATAALVEKVVNSIDSMLLSECLRRGFDPESPEAPSSMVDAAMTYFGIPEGNIALLKPADRARLAENVQLVATGSKTEPSYTIIDLGEGQRPCDFPSTFCSLVASNKLRVAFVQGKYNMGGSGALPFCGRRNMQLIVSKRQPEFVRGQSHTDEVGWGWTVIRRREPTGGRRSSHYEYLAPGGKVLSFRADSIQARPSRDSAYAEPLVAGTLIKLYTYQIEIPSAVVFDLNFELSRRLYQLPIPVRLYERREYRGHSRETILTGMSVRVADDRKGVLEAGFPDSGVIRVQGVGEVPVEVVLFKKGNGKNYLSAQTAILFTVNGQVHGGLGRRFCGRDEVRLDFVKNDLLIVLNCTQAAARVREDLFMPSRDRLRECAAKRAFEEALVQFLGEHEELHRLNRERREAELRDRLADDRPLTEALKSVIDNSPELSDLFKVGIQLPAKNQPGEEPEPFEGLRFPTFFRLDPEPAPGETAEFDCPIGDACRIRFVTDAANDYFERTSDPGTVHVTPATMFNRIRLRDGRASLILQCPERASVGAVLEVTIEVTDPSRKKPFSDNLRLRVTEKRPPRESESDGQKPNSGALSLPRVITIEEAGWEAEEFDPESGLAMQFDIDGGLVAKVNIDNIHLKQCLFRTREDERELMRRRFIYGLVLAGVSFWREFAEEENRDELVRTSTKALARVILPTILVLGNLERDLEPVA